MVDHDMGLVLDVCDRIVVLNLGKGRPAVGTPAEIEGNDEVKPRPYLGTTHAGRGVPASMTCRQYPSSWTAPDLRGGGSDECRTHLQ